MTHAMTHDKACDNNALLHSIIHLNATIQVSTSMQQFNSLDTTRPAPCDHDTCTLRHHNTCTLRNNRRCSLGRDRTCRLRQDKRCTIPDNILSRQEVHHTQQHLHLSPPHGLHLALPPYTYLPCTSRMIPRPHHSPLVM